MPSFSVIWNGAALNGARTPTAHHSEGEERVLRGPRLKGVGAGLTRGLIRTVWVGEQTNKRTNSWAGPYLGSSVQQPVQQMAVPFR
jgi:hypothetical protein